MDHVNKYIFITGSGRSGTNITKDLLSQHPDAYSLPFEYRFTVDPDGIISTYNLLMNVWSPYQATIAIDRFENLLTRMATRGLKLNKPDSGYDDWELDKWFPNYQHHVQTVIRQLSQIEYEGTWPGMPIGSKTTVMRTTAYGERSALISIFNEFLCGLYEELLEKNNATIFIEDNTWNILFAKDITSLFQAVKMLLVVRDPRDTIASMMKQKWCPNTLDSVIVFYKSLHKRIQEQKYNVSNEYIHQFKLEDLILDTPRVLRDISEFTEVEFSCHIQSNILSSESIGRWESDFTSSESEYINQQLHEEIEELEYR